MTTAKITAYDKNVRSFDHADLVRLDAYDAARRALSDLANDIDGMTVASFLTMVGDMALTAPYADACTGCREMVWPFRVVRDDASRLTCAYRCPRCRLSWSCGYAVDLPAYFG